MRRKDRAVDDAAWIEGLLAKYFPHLQAGCDYRPITSDELARTAVHWIEIDEWSGKHKQTPVDARRNIPNG